MTKELCKLQEAIHKAFEAQVEYDAICAQIEDLCRRKNTLAPTIRELDDAKWKATTALHKAMRDQV